MTPLLTMLRNALRTIAVGIDAGHAVLHGLPVPERALMTPGGRVGTRPDHGTEGRYSCARALDSGHCLRTGTP